MKPTAPPAEHAGGFEFGSYGRVQIASDLRGGTGREANIVAYGTRIDEDSYAELELRREDTFSDGIKNKVVTTLGLFPPFFQFTGDAIQNIGLRNLYDQASYGPLTLWVGSRMYRGDDIYLLDWWPLDNQNTVGGGIGVNLPPTSFGETSIAAHVGMERLDNPAQFEQIPVTAPFGIRDGERDRARPAAPHRDAEGHPPRAKLQGCAPDGERQPRFQVHPLRRGAGDLRRRPHRHVGRDRQPDADAVSCRLGLPHRRRDSRTGRANATRSSRSSRGTRMAWPHTTPSPSRSHSRQTARRAARTRRSPPSAGTSKPARSASSTAPTFATSPTATHSRRPSRRTTRGPWTSGRRSSSASTGHRGRRQLPGAALRRARSDDQRTALRGRVARRRHPLLLPIGRGSYKRPQLRIIYAITARNEGARALYAAQDVFSQRSIEHYLGLGVEWWFNSSSYP